MFFNVCDILVETVQYKIYDNLIQFIDIKNVIVSFSVINPVLFYIWGNINIFFYVVGFYDYKYYDLITAFACSDDSFVVVIVIGNR